METTRRLHSEGCLSNVEVNDYRQVEKRIGEDAGGRAAGWAGTAGAAHDGPAWSDYHRNRSRCREDDSGCRSVADVQGLSRFSIFNLRFSQRAGGSWRSEERRVGKEGRSRWWTVVDYSRRARQR